MKIRLHGNTCGLDMSTGRARPPRDPSETELLF
jgi:hypothetical protein